MKAHCLNVVTLRVKIECFGWEVKPISIEKFHMCPPQLAHFPSSHSLKVLSQLLQPFCFDYRQKRLQKIIRKEHDGELLVVNVIIKPFTKSSSCDLHVLLLMWWQCSHAGLCNCDASLWRREQHKRLDWFQWGTPYSISHLGTHNEGTDGCTRHR